MKDFIVKFIKGMIIGIAAVTAGAGTFAIVLGIYDRCMEIISNPFKNFKENLKYIFPIVLGILLSGLLFGKLVIYCLNNYNSYTRCVFLGIIIGGIPTLFKVANKKGFNKKYWLSLVLALIFTIIFTELLSSLKAGDTVTNLSKTELIIYGAIYAFGAVMPGMTTIHILVFMGVLPTIMNGLLHLDLSILLPFGIGYLIIALTTANIITYLFKKYYGLTYYAIIGFSITSLIMFIPEFKTLLEGIIGVLIIIILALIMFFITKQENNITKEKEKGIVDEG